MQQLGGINVSRETRERLDIYLDLLRKWNPRINLVSKSDLADVWHRHVVDSLQIWQFAPDSIDIWADLGSGGGFPGLVLAILAKEERPDARFVLIESDVRKCAFLQSVARSLDLQIRVENERIEQLDPIGAQVVSARALAPLGNLLGYAEKHLRPGGICLFPKGETVHKEIDEAARFWDFDCRIYQSLTNSKAAILEIGAIKRD